MSAPNVVASTEVPITPVSGLGYDAAPVNPVGIVPPIVAGEVTTTGMGDQPQPFHSSSLYVGDLIQEVNEGLLFEIFNAVGPVSSIRVCRDAITRCSLGYAYVNFHQIADAERALDTMNYTEIKGKPCRIMWSQRDPSLRRSGVGNIFVKNLKESIDNKQLYDTFSLFGNILSCKVVTDNETGFSKGYGYVHYETAEDAHAAIEKLDGMLIDGQEVQVGEFMGRNERAGKSEWTNCYVKNIPFDWNDVKLKEEFSVFGEVISAVVSIGPKKQRTKKKDINGTVIKETSQNCESDRLKVGEDVKNSVSDKKIKEDSNGLNSSQEKGLVSLGFGFVNFTKHEAAVEAVEKLNGKEIKTLVDNETIILTLYVGRAQKKNEREYELQAKFEAQKLDRMSKFQGVNLYIKNLDDSVTDEILRDSFVDFGNITSACIMRDTKTGRSKGFGFVCYSTPEEATRAISEMNNKRFANKPIYVALAQGREARRTQLEAQHSQRSSDQDQHVMGGGNITGSVGLRSSGLPMYLQHPVPNGGLEPAYPIMHQMLGTPGRGAPRGGYPLIQPQGRGNYSMTGYSVIPQQIGRDGRITHQGRGYDRAGRVQGHIQPRGVASPGRGSQVGSKFNRQTCNVVPGAMVTPTVISPSQQTSTVGPSSRSTTSVSSQTPYKPLTAAALVSASPEMQKNMIGERLYPLIYNSQPDHAGKITGMLLEMDNSELLHLLESPDALNAKISEALQVLEAHNSTSE